MFLERSTGYLVAIIITALDGMQTRSNDEILSVRLSLRLFVCSTRGL